VLDQGEGIGQALDLCFQFVCERSGREKGNREKAEHQVGRLARATHRRKSLHVNRVVVAM